MSAVAPPRTTGETPRAPRVDLRRFGQTYGLLVILVAVAIVFHVLSDGLFISERNVPLLLRQAAVTAIVAAGVALVIVAREIDLSIGSSVGLCGILAAWMMKRQGVPVGTAIALTVVAGMAMGLLQGVIVAYLRVPSFIVTLGGLLVFQGIGLLITEGTTIAGLPEGFASIGQGEVSYGATVSVAAVALAVTVVLAALGVRRTGRLSLSGASRVIGAAATLIAAVVLVDPERGLPIPVVIAAGVGVVLAGIARLTRFGRSIFAVGGNPAAAELAGIRVKRVTVAVFMLMGILYAVAAVVLVSRLDGAPPDGASPLELDAIAAAVIGGTSLAGGVGSVSGAVVGALLLASVSNGLDLLGVQSYWQFVATGGILVAAVFSDVRLRGRP
jgi:D-xylose transport system permease protein